MALKPIFVLAVLLAATALIASDFLMVVAQNVDGETTESVSEEQFGGGGGGGGGRYCCGGWRHGYCQHWCFRQPHCCGGRFHGQCQRWCH